MEGIMRERNRFAYLALRLLGLFLLGVGIPTPAANAAQEQDSFAGRTIRIIVPYATSGAFDRLARFVGGRVSHYIPGNPSVIVQNMPGGGGAVATNYLYNVAPKDGTAMAILNPTLILPQLIGQEEMQFDMAKFNWVGSLQRVNVACMIRKEAGIKHLPDILGSDKQQLLFGANRGRSLELYMARVSERSRCTDRACYGLRRRCSHLPRSSTRRGKWGMLHLGCDAD